LERKIALSLQDARQGRKYKHPSDFNEGGGREEGGEEGAGESGRGTKKEKEGEGGGGRDWIGEKSRSHFTEALLVE